MPFDTPLEQPPALPPPPKRRARWIVPLVLLFFFFGFLALVGLAVLGAVLNAETIADGTTLELRLDGGLSERPDALASALPGLAGPPSLFEIRDALERAKADPRIVAVKVDVVQVGFGWGMAQELVSLFDEFRSSGKPLHVYLRGDIPSDLDYFVGLGASRLWLAPESALFVNGLRAEVEFWKGTLDKLKIQPQFFMFREYKSAGEPMSRETMSEHFREATLAVIDDIWNDFLSEISKRRGIDPDAVRLTGDRGLQLPADALASRWVDALGYEEDLRAALLVETATTSYHAMSLGKYLRGSEVKAKEGESSRIAVVFGEGVIVSSGGGLFDDSFSGPRVAAAIRDAADDDHVAAILFRVDSPGGSAVGSDHVRRAIEYARKQRHKVVIASMGSVAGSGGYWVSLDADAIVARPSTITGSIGVVFGKLDVSGLYELAGAHVDTVQVGANAGLLSAVSTLDAEQTTLVTAWLERTYDDFKQRVATARSLDPVKVEEIARGRIWSGVDAATIGLVDRLGGYAEAIAIAREKASIPANHSIELVAYPPGETLFDLLFSDEGAIQAVRGLHTTTPATAARAVLEELSRPGVWLLTPALRIDGIAVGAAAIER